MRVVIEEVSLQPQWFFFYIPTIESFSHDRETHEHDLRYDWGYATAEDRKLKQIGIEDYDRPDLAWLWNVYCRVRALPRAWYLLVLWLAFFFLRNVIGLAAPYPCRDRDRSVSVPCFGYLIGWKVRVRALSRPSCLLELWLADSLPCRGLCSHTKTALRLLHGQKFVLVQPF